MLIAIDHGNYAVKTPHFSFISGLTEHTVKPPMAEEVLEYNGKYWSLTGQRLPYMRDKTRDDRYFILSLFAIAKELSAAGANTAFELIVLADDELAAGTLRDAERTLRAVFQAVWNSEFCLQQPSYEHCDPKCLCVSAGVCRCCSSKRTAIENAADVYRGYRRIYYRCASPSQRKAGSAILPQFRERSHHHEQ